MTDKGLPRMSGAELAVACRRQRPDVGIIFASGAVEVPKVEGYPLIADAVFSENRMTKWRWKLRSNRFERASLPENIR